MAVKFESFLWGTCLVRMRPLPSLFRFEAIQMEFSWVGLLVLLPLPQDIPFDRRGSRSNLHYDPYQNLLCVVRGTKRVRIFSPGATPYLYPMPLYGESPNHSSVDVTAPDLITHPLYREAAEHEFVADLNVRHSFNRLLCLASSQRQVSKSNS